MSAPTSRWLQAWPDLSAFLFGLSLAWWLDWHTTDLVWSLWLSSLVVGYALIVWTLFHPVIDAWRERQGLAAALADSPGKSTVGLLLLGLGGLFMLAFFTVHFGGFHLVHSSFLHAFFPVQETGGRAGWPDSSTYLEVVRRYGWFLPAAFIAERAAFLRVRTRAKAPPDTSVTAEAIARRKAAAKTSDHDPFFYPYKNVVRMHLLIFFFVGAHALKLDHFLLYAVVYAVYFFPWRLLSPQPLPPAP